MKIAIISTGYFWFPLETGTSRMFDLAMTFVRAGWETEVITTGFEHFEKRPRDIKRIRKEHYPFRSIFIPSPSYQRNIDIRRIYSNKKTAVNLQGYLKTYGNGYDVVYCTIPSNCVAATAAKFCGERGIPFVVDIEDLWPEAMRMVVKWDFLRNLLLAGVRRDAEYVYRSADGIVGTSEDYTRRAFQKRPEDIPAKTIYVGCDLKAFDEGVSKFGDAFKKRDGEVWVTYAGSLGQSYALKSLIEAAALLEHLSGTKQNTPEPTADDSERIRIKILGTGPLEQKLRTYAARLKCRNVDFMGFLPYEKMAACLSRSDIVINSFRKDAPQSIVNKIGDYLAAGKPMINTLENPLFQSLVEREGFGLNVEAENPKAIAGAVRYLLNHPKRAKRMSCNARHLAEERFDRQKSYQEIVKLVDEVSRKKRGGRTHGENGKR